MAKPFGQLVAVVPAAGVGKRMQAQCPKQYLTIGEYTVLEHTVLRLLEHPLISKVILALGLQDEYFQSTCLYNHPKVETVVGGQERVDSVLAGLAAIDIDKFTWALVHDAARPCISLTDISALIESCEHNKVGGLLATPVRDTMKRCDDKLNVLHTEERSHLWHAQTPQMYPIEQLIAAITQGLANNAALTDESSAIELAGLPSLLVEGSGENIKITHPDDLMLAQFILSQQANEIKNIREQLCE